MSLDDKEESEVGGGHPGPRCQHKAKSQSGETHTEVSTSLLGQEHRVEKGGGRETCGSDARVGSVRLVPREP